jgi:hypothetical protein
MKQKILYLLIIILGVASCKTPVPIYFNQPIGKSVNGFDSTMIGNFVHEDYFGIDKEVKKMFVINGLEISFKTPENKQPLAELENEEMDEGTDMIDKEEKNNEFSKENSEENQLLDLNTAYPNIKLNEQDSLIIFSYYNISPKKITSIGIDSSGKNYANVILEFNESVILTKYLDKYYINLKSAFGWEIMQVEKWHDNYLSFNMFHPTNYNDSCKTEKEFLSSIKNLYPNLKVIKNKENKIVGVKAKTKPEKILKLFQMQDETLKYELFKIGRD